MEVRERKQLDYMTRKGQHFRPHRWKPLANQHGITVQKTIVNKAS